MIPAPFNWLITFGIVLIFVVELAYRRIHCARRPFTDEEGP